MSTLASKLTENVKREVILNTWRKENKQYTCEIFFSVYKQEDWILESFVRTSLTQKGLIDGQGFITKLGTEYLFSWFR